MAVPEFQTLMLPLLHLANDGEIHTGQELAGKLSEQFNLSAADRREMLPSRKQSRILNRTHWAIFYLRKAALLERTSRGRVRITDRGRALLREKPERIDKDLLMRFPEFAEFRERSSVQPDTDASGPVVGGSDTPEAVLEESYQLIRNALAQEVLERVKGSDPAFFEQMVVDLLVAMGYGGSQADAGRAVGGTGDGGIDGIIKEDKLGLDAVYIQAKRWENAVGRPVVQSFAGSLEGHRARKGVMITTSSFSPDARLYVENIEKKIVLIDGEQLAQLLIDHNVGVTETARYVLKRVDSDYFGD